MIKFMVATFEHNAQTCTPDTNIFMVVAHKKSTRRGMFASSYFSEQTHMCLAHSLGTESMWDGFIGLLQIPKCCFCFDGSL